jgi:hypothetical protein
MERRLLTVRRTLLGVAAGVIMLVVVAASSASPSQADRLRAIETARLQALVDGDATAAGRSLAADYQLINPAGVALSRDEFLGGVAAGFPDFLALEPTGRIEVRQSGDSATLRYPTSFDLVVGGTRLTHAGWTTQLYERRDGHWQAVWGQSTAIPNRPELLIQALEPTP